MTVYVQARLFVCKHDVAMFAAECQQCAGHYPDVRELMYIHNVVSDPVNPRAEHSTGLS